MRYYSIRVIDPTSGDVLVPNTSTRVFTPTAAGAGVVTYASHINGTFYPGALNIEIDATVYPFAVPQGGSALKVCGVSLTEIGQRSQLADKIIEVSAGMQKGLPLVTPSQAGVIFRGKIFQAFGNWQGTEQSLDFVVWPDEGTAESPKNIVVNWVGGTLLSEALQATLAVAFPDLKISINISPNLTVPNDQVGVYQTLTQLAQYVKGITSKISVSSNYAGVDIAMSPNKINVFDGTVTPASTTIAFKDLVGQPTWIDAATINLPLVMRSDLSIGDTIMLPTGTLGTPYTLTSSSAALPNTPATVTTKNSINFNGTFIVSEVHHFGNYRQPDANSWVTVVDAIAQTASA